MASFPEVMQHHIYSKKKDLDAPCVLFQDYNAFWAPLNDLFFSTSSNTLVSRHPESSIEEVVSHYCPQCLKKYSEDDTQKFSNRCATCFQCPSCESLLRGALCEQDSKQFCLACSNCSWSSTSCDVIGASEEDLSSLVLSHEKYSQASTAFATILSSLNTPPTVSVATAQTSRQHKSWDIQALENMRQEQASISHSSNPQIKSSLYPLLSKDNNVTKEEARKSRILSEHMACSDDSLLSTAMQRVTGELSGSSITTTTLSLLPQRMYLRTKKMLRCRRDVRAGKMSILLQPKTFPLEGDSSHKLHQGKWFLKDASACHHVPRIVITKLPEFSETDSAGCCHGHLHLEVSNSKDSDVVVLFSAAASGADQDGGEGVSSNISSGDSVTDGLTLEPHPPFAFKRVNVLRVSSMPVAPVVLQGYEDELLRDDCVGSGEVADFASEVGDGNTWEVLLDHHIAKLCIPVSYVRETADSDDCDCSGNDQPVYAVMTLSMLVADVSSEEHAQSLKNSGVNANFRVAFQL